MTENRFNFRFYHKKDKKIYNVLQLFARMPDENFLRVFLNKPIESEEQFTNWKVGIDGILMQSTNLTDINGKEIFEGDILRDGDDIIVVNWSNTWSKFVVSYIDGEEEYQNIDFEDLEHPIFNFKIIGNIYQNPELLKQ